MQVAFIHNDKKIQTGAHYINDLMSTKLQERGVRVKHFYPRSRLLNTDIALKGLQNILFFHSLLEHKNEILRCNLIQGTTYTPLAFLPFSTPIVAHFGSTTKGFLNTVPLTHNLDRASQSVIRSIHRDKVVTELNIKTRRPLRDIAEIESFVARRSKAVIATSSHVASELKEMNVLPERTHLVHNAIEDFWFHSNQRDSRIPGIVYVGRIGSDVFTLKLKGFDRLVNIYREFPQTPKTTIAMTANRRIGPWMQASFSAHSLFINLLKESIAEKLSQMKGSIILNPSRYEGFGLSMVEGMSQGLIPVSFPNGVALEIIKNGQNGYLVNSLREAKDVMREILENERLRADLSDAAQKTAQMFTADHMVDNLVAVYKKVLFSD